MNPTTSSEKRRGPGRDSPKGPGLRLPLAAAAAAAALLFLLSCGVKTHPRPELETLPAKVADLRQDQDDKGNFVLSFRAPTTNAAGRPLSSLSRFEIWEASFPLSDYCETCPANFERAGVAPAQPPPPGATVNPKPYYWGKTLTEGRVYRFRVAAFSGRGAAHPDQWTELAVYALSPPPPPGNFRVSVGDKSVLLTFDPPEARKDGTLPTFTEIDRRVGETPWESLVLTRDREHADLSVEYDNDYTYRARRVISRGDSLVPGPFGPEVTVRVEDREPLPPISFLDASLSARGVILNWESMAGEPGFRFYRLYRRLGPDDGWKLLAGRLAENTHLDETAPPDSDPRYVVTSVDDSPRGNESLPSPEALLRVEPEPEPGEKPDLRDIGF
ncbi:MAG: hypothetical protein LBF41_05395 [Deltaproteobacteria bacterium]|nr:hypothetical protein [Deltaproteobacteria bacterium]